MLHSSALSSSHFFLDCSNLGEDTTEYGIGSRLAFASFFAIQIKMKKIIAWIEYEMEAIAEMKPSILGQLKDKFGLVEGKHEHGKVKPDRYECRQVAIMAKKYFTLCVDTHYFGNDFVKKGIGKVGYVANSAYTVQGDTMSAGRLCYKIGNKAKAKIIYVIPGGAICKFIEKTHEACGVIPSPKIDKADEIKFGTKYEEEKQ